MTRSFGKIVDICDQKELWKVIVKVHYKWIMVTNNKEHFELIFVNADVIHGFHFTTAFVIVVLFLESSNVELIYVM